MTLVLVEHVDQGLVETYDFSRLIKLHPVTNNVAQTRHFPARLSYKKINNVPDSGAKDSDWYSVGLTSSKNLIRTIPHECSGN